MGSKPLFDSDKGRALFSQLQEGLNDILKWNGELKSKDPAIRKKAQENLQKALDEAKGLFEKIKKDKPELLAKMQAMFSNPDNYSLEQREITEHLQRKYMSNIVSKPSKEKISSDDFESKKKKSAKKKWMKS